MHNAVVESFLSQTEIGTDKHLKKMGAADFIYVNTTVMYRDFVESFTRFRSDIKHDPELMKRAADRLEWREYNPSDDLDPDVATPSPPPPVRFIFEKRSPKCE